MKMHMYMNTYVYTKQHNKLFGLLHRFGMDR